MDDALAGRLGQYIDNNRGIALLMTARTETDAPPDCAASRRDLPGGGRRVRGRDGGRPDEPGLPDERGLGRSADRRWRSATALLTEALEKGIPLVAPAHNDLGVLAAQRGEFGDARAHFVQAIATDPDYDLATWNLGVLESRQAGPLLVAGQALLAGRPS